MPPIAQDELDGTPNRQLARGFEGFDNATDPTKLPEGIMAEGLNVRCKGDGYVETRPGSRLHCNPADGGILGMTYFDQPASEYFMIWTNNNVRRAASAGNNVASTAQYAQAAAVLRDARAQLMTLIFWLSDAGVINFMDPTVGAASVGTVTTFSDASAMPTWSHIVVQNFRLLAFSTATEKLYTSAIGAASLAANWAKTDNIRVGDGDGDPATTLISGQAGFVIMLCGNSCWQINIADASVANWSSLRITKLAGCIGQRNAVAVSQDVYFLSRYGIVNLGTLSETISISPASTLSAPIQPYIDRINWGNVGFGFATKWRDLILFALPLDSESLPTRLFPFHLGTRRWLAPWVFAGSPSIFCAAISRFGTTEETHIALSSTILRLDESVVYDEFTAGAQTTFESWAVLRRMDHGANQQYKQPLFRELVFNDTTGANIMSCVLLEGEAALTTYAAMINRDSNTTRNFSGSAGVIKKRFLDRGVVGRFFEGAIQVWATSGKLKLREAALSSFIDPPFFT